MSPRPNMLNGFSVPEMALRAMRGKRGLIRASNNAPAHHHEVKNTQKMS